MNRVFGAILFTSLVLSAAPVVAQQAPDFSKVEIKTTDLGHNTYMLEGMGGNMTAIVGDDAIILIDGEFAPLHDKIKAALAKISDKPVRYLVNTHYHGDHTGGNEPYAKDGATVVAQVNVRKRLAEGTTNGLTGAKTPPATEDALPTRTYDKSLVLKVKGRTAQLTHAPNAHTDGDTYVYVKDANVLSTGDIVSLGRYPNIDVANGGNIKGMIAGTTTYVKLATSNTKIVPGHGPMIDKVALTAYRDFLVGARDRVAKLVAAGKSEDDTVAAKPLADLDASVGANEQASANFVKLIYRSLKG